MLKKIQGIEGPLRDALLALFGSVGFVLMIVVLLVVTLVTYLIFQVVPSDPAPRLAADFKFAPERSPAWPPRTSTGSC